MVRWTQRRKALVVEAVRNGAISLTEACRRYELSVEEFRAWQRAVETDGEEASQSHPAKGLPGWATLRPERVLMGTLALRGCGGGKWEMVSTGNERR